MKLTYPILLLSLLACASCRTVPMDEMEQNVWEKKSCQLGGAFRYTGWEADLDTANGKMSGELILLKGRFNESEDGSGNRGHSFEYNWEIADGGLHRYSIVEITSSFGCGIGNEVLVAEMGPNGKVASLTLVHHRKKVTRTFDANGRLADKSVTKQKRKVKYGAGLHGVMPLMTHQFKIPRMR